MGLTQKTDDKCNVKNCEKRWFKTSMVLFKDEKKNKIKRGILGSTRRILYQSPNTQWKADVSFFF